LVVSSEYFWLWPWKNSLLLADVAAGKVEGGWAGQVFFWLGLAATIIVAGMVTRLARKSLREAEQAGKQGNHSMR